MNIAGIKKLSQQCYNLETFKDRCAWASADLAVGEFLLDADSSALIILEVQRVVETQIEALKVEIKTEASK